MRNCVLLLGLLAACASRATTLSDATPSDTDAGSVRGASHGLNDGLSAPEWGQESGSPDLLASTVAWRTQVSGTTQELRGIWGSSATDIYVVGDAGTILHSSGGGAWTAQTSGTTKRLNAVWGSSAQDLYVAGNGIVLRSSGDGNWRSETPSSADYRAVWGSGPGDVYIAGVIDLAHSSGDGAWTALPSSRLSRAYFGLGGRDANDVWAVGGDAQPSPGQPIGGAERYTGSWSWIALGSMHNMKGIAFTKAGAWIVGNGGEIWFDDGSGFDRQSSNTPYDLLGVWASSDDQLFVVGGSGTVVTSSGNGQWSSETTPSALPLNAVWGIGPLDLYAVGYGGEILHRSKETP